MKLRSNVNLATMVASAGLLAAGMTSANATITIGPGSANPLTGPFGGTPYASNPTTAQIATALGISPASSLGSELYKATPGASVASETGSAAVVSSYNTVYFPLPAADSASGTVTITWSGPTIIGATALLVKDGNEGHYAFNLSGWDGKETLVINNPYPNQGTISHISIYGTGTRVTTVVPEPSTYVAGGLALVPLLLGLRSRLAKKA